jgi:hypothetical protein
MDAAVCSSGASHIDWLLRQICNGFFYLALDGGMF